MAKCTISRWRRNESIHMTSLRGLSIASCKVPRNRLFYDARSCRQMTSVIIDLNTSAFSLPSLATSADASLCNWQRLSVSSFDEWSRGVTRIARLKDCHYWHTRIMMCAEQRTNCRAVVLAQDTTCDAMAIR